MLLASGKKMSRCIAGLTVEDFGFTGACSKDLFNPLPQSEIDCPLSDKVLKCRRRCALIKIYMVNVLGAESLGVGDPWDVIPGMDEELGVSSHGLVPA